MPVHLLRLALVLLLGAPASALALTTTTTVSFPGSGGCNVCGSPAFACSDGVVGTWGTGDLDFFDPLPSGNWTVTGIDVQLNGALDCDSGAGSTAVYLNFEPVGGTQAPTGACTCDSCNVQSWTEIAFPDSSYVHGGTNTVWIDTTANLCVASVDVEITYESGCADNDGDGATDASCGGTDCDDFDASNYPGNTEICDGQDNDCDFTADEGFDADNDGWTTCGGDCDDFESSANPGTTEASVSRCQDGIDNDCDFLTDASDPDCDPFLGDDDDAADDDDAVADDDDAVADDDDAVADDDDAVADDDDSASTGDDDDDDGGGGGGGRGRSRGCDVGDAGSAGLLVSLLALGALGLRRRRD